MSQRNESHIGDLYVINNPEGELTFKENESLKKILIIGIDSVPPSLENWINRDNIQEDLCKRIKSESRLIGIFGLGGFGKSSLAAWAYHNLASGFCKKLWISIPKDIPFNLFALWLLRELGCKVEEINYQPSDQDLALELLKHLREKPYLLIIDQLEMIASSENWSSYRAFLTDWLERGECSKLLLTTKRKLCEADHWIHLKGLERKQFDKVLNELGIVSNNPNHVRDLAIATEGHPLLLKLVIVWLKQHGQKLEYFELTSEYLRFFENLFQNDQVQLEAKVEKVFKNLFNQLNSNLRTLLTGISVYRNAFSMREVKAIAPEAEIADIQLLSEKSFLIARPEDQRWTLHPLIQELVHKELEQLESFKAAHLKAGIFFSENTNSKKFLPDDCGAEIESFYHFCKANDYTRASFIIENCVEFLNKQWGGYGLLIPLYKQLINEWLENYFSSKEQLIITINLIHLGDAIHGSLNNFEEAINAYQEASSLLNSISDFDKNAFNFIKINLLHRLARTYLALGKYQEDIACNQEALQISKNIDDKKYELCSLKNLELSISNSKSKKWNKFTKNTLSVDNYFEKICEKNPNECSEFINEFGRKVVIKGFSRLPKLKYDPSKKVKKGDYVVAKIVNYENDMVLDKDDQIFITFPFGRCIASLNLMMFFKQ
ncbi:MAG: tetratricopeptide repeat protein [Spirulinaceae cyanobacterium]